MKAREPSGSEHRVVPGGDVPLADDDPTHEPAAGAGPTDTSGTVMVTFQLPHAVIADRVCVVGEFNDWSRTANMMERDGDVFVTQIALVPGRAYRYRYLLDDEQWENDWAADRYVRNEFGGEDSVIDLTDPSSGSQSDPAR